jgi:hypothetical protein
MEAPSYREQQRRIDNEQPAHVDIKLSMHHVKRVCFNFPFYLFDIEFVNALCSTLSAHVSHLPLSMSIHRSIC